MAVSVYGLGKGGKRKKGEKSHAEVGKENIRSLVAVFRRHAIGSETDMHLNHVGFRSLCQDLRLGSHDISNRLFAAMDTDNTGVLDVHEFWTGMRRMHDTASVDRKERIEFAFNLFNIERNAKGQLDSRVDRQELVGFFSSFYTEACDLRSGWLRRWIDHFETIFGRGVASAHTVGRASATRWEQTAGPLLLEHQSLKEVHNAARSLCDSVLELVRLAKSRPVDDDELKSKKKKKKGDEDDSWVNDDDDDDHSLSRAGFMSWCDAHDKKLRLGVLPWLEELGAAWLQRSGDSPEERRLDGLASATLGFAVQRRPNGDSELQKKFDALEDEQIHVLFASHSTNGLMAKGEFDNWLIELGVSNPYLRGRLFAIFDRDSDRFIEFDEFHDGLRKLIAGKPKVELAFSLFDVDANGVIGEDELRAFIRGFFEQLTADVNQSMHVLETLLSIENDDVITVATCARDACQQFVDSYTDAIVKNVFRTAKSDADRRRDQRGHGAGNTDDGPQKLFVSEFARWCREHNDCVLAFFESFAHEILSEMGAFAVDRPNVDVEFGHRPEDHRSKLMRLIDPNHHIHKPHLPHLAGGKHDSLHFRRTGDELFADSHAALQHDELVGHHKLSQRHHLAHVVAEDFHRVLVATGIEVDAGVIQRQAEHWASKRLAISEQVAQSEANRSLREGRRALERGDLDAAVYLFKRGIEQQKALDQTQSSTSARRMTKDEALAHHAHTDDLHKKGILDSDQAEKLKGGISESLEEELEKAINARDERDLIIVEDMIKQQKGGKSALQKKHAAVKQPGRLTGAPQVPPPSSCFPREEVHRIQDIYLAVSQDGVMGPAEWTRCLRFAGIENEVVALRLFEIFDTSGDLQLNAKEFTCGLSDICNAYQPGKSVEEVRRAFAFRFYDVDGEGHFDKKECCAHLMSYRLAAIKAIDRRTTEICTSVFGLVESDLTAKVAPKMTKLTDQLDADLTEFVEDIFALFGDDKGETMNWEHFKRFTLKAPMVVDWLTTLGQNLKDSFSKMDTDLNFEGAVPIPDPGSVMSDEKVISAFTRFAGEGGDNALIDEGEFVELMTKELKVSNPRLGQLLFRAFDVGGNGGVTRSEFVSRWKVLTNDDVQSKLSMIFNLFDVKAQGCIDKGALRLFFLSFFDTAIDSVQTLRKNLDQWVNGKVDPDSKVSKGVPNHFFVGASRKKKFQLAKDLLKLAQTQASHFVDVAVEHVMRNTEATMTLKDGFAEFLDQYPSFVNWLSSLASPWMVPPVATKADVDPEQIVIQPGDVGKTAAAILDTATKEAMGSASLTQLAPGSVWWARAMDPSLLPRKLQRIVMRPITHFDRVWLADIKTLFADEIAARRVYNPESLGVVLDHGIGLTNPLIVDRLYRMFDVNQDGNLTAGEIATGLLLLGMGSLSERMQLSFDLFDLGRDGIMMSHEFGIFLSALRAVSVDVIDCQIELLSEVFGPPAAGVGHGVRKAREFKDNILAAAKHSLDSRVQMLQERAFVIDDLDAAGAGSMTRAEFMLFLQVHPALESWVSRLGIGCLEALAPLEDRALPTTGRRPTDSTYRARRKYPKGTQFDEMRVGIILEAVKRHAHYGWLDQHAFAQVLCELRIYNPATLRRLHTLLDFSNGGCATVASKGGADDYSRANLGSRVHVRDASASLLLLSGDSWRVKFRNAFFLFDADGRGRLYRAEWQQLLRSFGMIGLDVIRTAVGAGLIADLVGDVGNAEFSSTVLGLSHGRLLAWLSTLEQSCQLFCDLARKKRRTDLLRRGGAGLAALASMDDDENGPEIYTWEDVEQWAVGHADFGRWVDSLRNLWLDSIVELESGPDSIAQDDSGAAGDSHSNVGGESGHGEYGYDFVVKKIYTIQMPPAQPQEGNLPNGETVLTKKLQYTNPYSTPLSISLYTDSPTVLTATFWVDPQAEQLGNVVLRSTNCAQIAPWCSTKFALRFRAQRTEVRRRRGRDSELSGSREATVRLFVHNENDQHCEECIAFDLIGM